MSKGQRTPVVVIAPSLSTTTRRFTAARRTEGKGVVCFRSGDEGAVDQKKKGLDRSATKCTDIFETNAQSRVERVV